MDTPVNAAETDLVTSVVNLPGIPLVAGSPQYQLYEREETVLGVALEFRVAAGTVSTDAQIATDVTSIELWDGDAQLMKPFTTTELIAIWNRYATQKVARIANSGLIPLPVLPKDFLLTLTGSRFGLGRATDDGSGISKLKIVVNWAAVIATTVLCTPVITFDPTERRKKLGRHYRLDRITYTQTGTGEQKIPEAFRDSNAISCKEVLVNTAVGTFVNCTVQQANQLWYSQSRPPILNQLEQEAGFSPIGSRQAIVFNTRNDPSCALKLKGYPPAELTVNWSVAPGASDIIAVKEYEGRVTW